MLPACAGARRNGIGNSGALTFGQLVEQTQIFALRLAAAPEPSAVVALGLGGLMLAGVAVRRRRTR